MGVRRKVAEWLNIPLQGMAAKKAVQKLQARGIEPQKGTFVEGDTLAVKHYGDVDHDALSADFGAPVYYKRGKETGAVGGEYDERKFRTEYKIKNERKPAKDDPLEPLAWAGERYPEAGDSVQRWEPAKNDFFTSKRRTAEEEAIMARRAAAQKEIDAGNYDPYFKVEDRYDAPREVFEDTWQDTTKHAIPKKQATIDEVRKVANDPEALKRLHEGYLAGEPDVMSHDWYPMGQLYDEYVKVYGPERAPQEFRDGFSKAMAVTTAGQKPEPNYLMAHMGNFLRKRGERFPDSSVDISSPVGGQYTSGNARGYNENIIDAPGTPVDAVTNPKGADFSQAFEGNPDAFTTDKRMSSAWGLNAPSKSHYGLFSEAGRETARAHGKEPRNYQGVGWVGLDEKDTGKPAIEYLNESIERTRRVTGLPVEDVVEGMVKHNRPMYGVAAAATTGAGMLATDEEAEAAATNKLGAKATAAIKRAANAAGRARRGGTDSSTAQNLIMEQINALSRMDRRLISENDRQRGLDKLFEIYRKEQERVDQAVSDAVGVASKGAVPEDAKFIFGEQGGTFAPRVERPLTVDEEIGILQFKGVERDMKELPAERQGNFGDPGPYFADPYEPKFYNQEGKHGDVKEIPVKDGKALYGGGAAAGALSIDDAEADPGGALAGSGVSDSNGRITGFLEGADAARRGFMNLGEEVFADMGGSALALASLVSDNLRGQPADYEKAKRWYNKISHGTELLTDDPSLENFRAADILDDFAARHPYVGGTVQGLMDSLGNAVDYLDVNQEKAPEWAHPFIYGTGAIF